MTIINTPLPARDDTLLGVCQAIGDDLGFNPDWLRIVLAASLLWDAKLVIAGYLVAGVAIALIHWLIPIRRTSVAEHPSPLTVPAPQEAPEPLPLAA